MNKTLRTYYAILAATFVCTSTTAAPAADGTGTTATIIVVHHAVAKPPMCLPGPCDAEALALADRSMERTAWLMSEPPLTVDPALNYSSEGLVEEPLPEGGVFVDLKGRFVHRLSAVTTENGQTAVRCGGTLAAEEH